MIPFLQFLIIIKINNNLAEIDSIDNVKTADDNAENDDYSDEDEESDDVCIFI